MDIVTIALDQLRAHPANANVMEPALLRKLKAHIARTDRYPPIIVRPIDGAYQLLDGHHRVAALRSLGRREARCVVWDVDDREALVLLATLNRLQGRDDPTRRAELLDELRRSMDLEALAAALPEEAEDLDRLLRLREPPPAPSGPESLDDLPVAVHFLLQPGERRRLERRLREVGGTREEALMAIVENEREPGALPRH